MEPSTGMTDHDRDHPDYQGRDFASLEEALKYLVLSLASLHQKVNHMTKSQDDMQAEIDATGASTTQLLTDIAAEVASLNQKITTLQSQTPQTDFTPFINGLEAIRQKIVAADPGVQTPSPVTGSAPATA